LIAYDLQVPQLVKENVVQQESPDRQRWPFPAWLRTKLLGRLAHAEGFRQTHPGRQGAQGYLPATTGHIAKRPRASAPIIEVDSPKPTPQAERQTAQDSAHILLVDVVEAVGAGR
jgi:hypothetical protein